MEDALSTGRVMKRKEKRRKRNFSDFNRDTLKKMVLKCYLSLTELTILSRWPVSVAVTEKVKGFSLLLQSCKKSQSNGVRSSVLRCYLGPFLDSQRSECLSLVEQALWGWKPTQLFHGIMDSRPTFRAEWYCVLETPTTPCLRFTRFLFFTMPK